MAELLQSSVLKPVPHGFSTRIEGEDWPQLEDLKTVRIEQVHSARVLAIGDGGWRDADLSKADAMVTTERGISLGIVTADCAPILLTDRQAGVIGAVHAGWRGAVEGIVENTIAAMCALSAQPGSIRAAIGPTIAQANYEVDAPFRANFAERDDRFFAPGASGRWQFDLAGYVARLLNEAGVGIIDDLALDTYADADRFHSYRRASHRGMSTQGRQLSLIGLPL